MSPSNTLVETPETVTTCPQCGSAEPWGTNSWCPDCGYYPKFSSADPKPVAAEPAADEEEVEAEGMPSWAIVLIVGMVVIMFGSLGTRAWVHFNGGQRAWVALYEMIIGFGFVGTTSVLALIRRRKADNNLTLFDAISNPVSVWRPVLEEMPETRKLVWFGSWGLTMILAANVCVGGIKYSGLYTNDWGFKQPKRKKSNLMGAIAEVAGEKKKSKEEEEVEEELEEFLEAKRSGAPAKPPVINTFVYGFLADDSHELGRILLAHRKGGRLLHAAVIKGSDLDDETYTVLERMVGENLTEAPAVSSSLNAYWVKPTIKVRMTFEGFAGGGELLKPSFKSLEAMDKSQSRKTAGSDDEDLEDALKGTPAASGAGTQD